jgi:hypothetical protein
VDTFWYNDLMIIGIAVAAELCFFKKCQLYKTVVFFTNEGFR